MRIAPPSTLRQWEAVVRQLLEGGIQPAEVFWGAADVPDLFARNEPAHAEANGAPAGGSAWTGSRHRADQAAGRPEAPDLAEPLVRIAEAAIHHRHPRRWDVLYRVAWRLAFHDHRLLQNQVDSQVRDVLDLRDQVRRDVHKMHAFVRFRRVDDADGPTYVAWYRPDHLILPLVRRFFVDRFASMRWSILTPDGSLHWDGTTCHDGPPARRADAPDHDALERLWRTYYQAIFNPARLNLRAMRREMPQRHWDLLPETQGLGALVAAAPERTASMVRTHGEAPSARPFVPDSTSLPTLAEASRACKGCDLYRHATQTVFGAGPRTARIVLVGEQPGDEEDSRGAPFVGPAGRVLDAALEEAGVPRAMVYVTNAVKHFKHEPRGKWRIHKKPDAAEVRACRPWLEAELHAVRPRVVVCLGATAAQSLLGPQARVGTAASPVPSAWAPATLVTYHPSAVLRARDEASGEEMRARLVHDLALARELSEREG